MLKIYNNLTRTKEIFEPIMDKRIGIYVCGVTVYDYCHIGHARTYVCFDTMVRFLKSCNYQVWYVRNITDIDDKIIKRSAECKQSVDELTQYYTQAMHEDFSSLGILEPDVEPKATQHIPQIISLIETLIERGMAYQADNGDVYFRTARFEGYGKLSHKDLSGQIAGKRVDENQSKEHFQDFVLWKQAKPGEPLWDSPWGLGRPGWHIECSAMSMHYLQQHFDIHGGGFDLQFPHHDNEIAQSEGATGNPFANYWLHVGFLQINQEKMSKSLNNFITIRDLLKDNHAEVVRYFLIASHYRSQLNFEPSMLDNATAGLSKLYGALKGLPLTSRAMQDSEYERQFQEAMYDDFNTAAALAVLFELANRINRSKINETNQADSLAVLLKHLANILGLLLTSSEKFFHRNPELDVVEIERLLELRTQARSEKNWPQADRIREQLQAQGVELEDSFHGTLWRVKS